MVKFPSGHWLVGPKSQLFNDDATFSPWSRKVPLKLLGCAYLIHVISLLETDDIDKHLNNKRCHLHDPRCLFQNQADRAEE